jgi:hypothetical protein
MLGRPAVLYLYPKTTQTRAPLAPYVLSIRRLFRNLSGVVRAEARAAVGSAEAHVAGAPRRARTSGAPRRARRARRGSCGARASRPRAARWARLGARGVHAGALPEYRGANGPLVHRGTRGRWARLGARGVHAKARAVGRNARGTRGPRAPRPAIPARRGFHGRRAGARVAVVHNEACAAVGEARAVGGLVKAKRPEMPLSRIRSRGV